MKRIKNSKGITLVALIITIILLLILATVAIRTVTDDGIIKHAKGAANEYTIAQEKEELQANILRWQLVKDNNEEPTLVDFLGEEYGIDNIQLNTDESITVTVPSGNRYVVTESGEATLLDGTVEEPVVAQSEIVLDKTTITKEIGSGETLTERLTARLVNVTGDLTWSSSDTGVAEISGEGNTRTITIKAIGAATITVSNGEYSATCSVTVTEKPVPQIGDKVAYKEGTGKTSSIDSAFVMDDLEWRILDIEDDGTIELISTQPTTSTLRLSGEDGYLNGEKYLDTLCDDLYGKGAGATRARSLKVVDIDKFVGITTDADKQACTSNYGSRWQFQYSATAGKMQYRKSTDNGVTWSEWIDMSLSKGEYFKEPGKIKIDKDNYLDSQGNQRIADLTSTAYRYQLGTGGPKFDGIYMYSMITKGLNDTNDGVGDNYIAQWLSSPMLYCNYDGGWCINYGFLILNGSGQVEKNIAILMHGKAFEAGMYETRAYRVRPVVVLKSDAINNKVDGVWQIGR